MKTLKRRLSSAGDLMEAGLIDPALSNEIDTLSKHYAIGVSDYLAQRLKEDAGRNIALKRQYIPASAELQTSAAEHHDPIGDNAHSPVKGIVHRYPDRVLLKVAEACAVYCRYCFRREMVGQGQGILSGQDLDAALGYIQTHPEIFEVILTGGDPFILSPAKMKSLIARLNDIDHVKIIRIHTRVPVADPSRVGEDLCDALRPKERSKPSNTLTPPKPLYIVLHINHASEISGDVVQALENLRKAGCTLLSQSVLLRGVNDDAQVLMDLYRALLGHDIKPYYLHHPDLAKGTKHFRLPVSEGKMIYRQLLGRLSGLARPLYMLDIPGGYGKIPVDGDHVREISNGTYTLTDYRGRTHIYKDDCL